MTNTNNKSAKVTKINGSELNNAAISVEALKSSDVGDMVLIINDCNELTLFKVTSKVATRGRNGGTALTLVDMVGNAKLDLPNTNTLPSGVVFVRKVLPGVNEKTLRKLAPKAVESVAVSDQPIEVVIPEIRSEAAEIILPATPVAEPVTDRIPCGWESVDTSTDDTASMIADIIAQ